MAVISDGDRQRILENAYGVREIDAAFSQIGRSLLRIPLVIHQSQCMYECAPLSIGATAPPDGQGYVESGKWSGITRNVFQKVFSFIDCREAESSFSNWSIVFSVRTAVGSVPILASSRVESCGTLAPA